MLRPRALTCVVGSLLACVASCHLAHADDDSAAPLQIGRGGVQVIGPADARVNDLERAVMDRLSTSANLQVLTSPETAVVFSRERARLLGEVGSASPPPQGLPDAGAVVYLNAVTEPEVIGDGPPRVSAVVVWLNAQSCAVFPTPSVALDADDCLERIVSQIYSLLPPIGKVIGLIQTGDEISVQLDLDSSRVGALKPKTELSLHRPRPTEAVVVRSGDRQTLRVDLPGAHLCTVTTKSPAGGPVEATMASGETPSLGSLVMAAPAVAGAYAEMDSPMILLTDPPGALCHIEGEVLGATPLVVEAPAVSGAEMTLACDGHEPLTASLPADLDGLSWWQGELEEIPPFGSLRIVSQPEGAVVMINGEEKGETPILLPRIAAGQHDLKLAMPNHRPFIADIEITVGERTDIQAALPRSAQPLTITSEPGDVNVLVGNERLGQTPLEDVSVPVGRHTLIARKEGYSELRRTVTVGPDAPPEPIELKLEPLPGSLAVVSEPRGASVYLDGKPVGSTPLEMANVAAGEHALRVARSGYETWEDTITIEPGTGERRELRLSELCGTLTISTVPEEARVYLDGHLLGNTPIEQQTAGVGVREVVIRCDGYETWRREVEVREDEETRVSVALIEEAEPERPAPSPPETAEGVVEVRLVAAEDDTPVTLRISIEEQPAQHRTVCRLWLSGGFPDPTRTASVGKMISVVIPGLICPGGLRSFDVPRGAISSIRVGQQSTRDQTVRVELHTVLDGRVEFGEPADRALSVTVAAPTRTGRRTSKPIALTFDDFPFHDSERLLDCLDALEVRATLFVVGNKVEVYSDLMRRAACAGHALENHSYSHPEFLRLSEEEVAMELRRCNEAIESVVGEPPVLARPPGGHSNGNHRSLMRSLGLRYCGWTVNTSDYRMHDSSTIVRKVLDEARPEAIILMHDGVSATINALRQIVPTLRSRGYSFVTVRELIGRDTSETEGRQVVISTR